jgi:glycerol transport system ATP-binding protein
MTLALESIESRVGGELHLAGISLALAPGAVNVLLGPTGAGKTSLMRLMAGLDRPTAGRVRVDGADVTGLGVRKRSVAMVYQQFVNYPSFTVYENIASPLRLAGRLPAAEIDRRVRETAAMMHIDGLLDRLPAQLSGGQQQRTAIARALVRESQLLLLDEPLVNLDYKLREELRAEMGAIFKRREATVVYATTEPLEALLLGGSTAVLDQGRVLQFGPTLSVYHHPASTRVAEIFSDPPMNLLPARIEGGAARLVDGPSLPLGEHMRGLPAGDYRLGVRANHVGLAAGGGQVGVPGTVELAEISGSETFVHVRHQSLTVVAQLEGVHGFELGCAVTLALDPQRLFAFDAAGRLAASPRREDAMARGAA